jgi:Zn-dependent protease
MARTNARIPFTVHRSGGLLIAIVVALAIKDLGFANGVLAGLLVIASLLVHELAHATAALLFDVPVYRIGIKFVGAYIHRKHARRPAHDVIIAACGPLSSLLLTAGCFFLPTFGVWLAEWNFGIALLNLLPLPGTDGYRILKTLFRPNMAVYQQKLPDAA